MNEIEPVVEQGQVPAMAQNPMVQVAVQAKIAEIQARITVARAKPRDWERIESALVGHPDGLCWDPKLADEAVWEYPKGGQNLSGPSIRLLETVARLAGNIDYGINTLAVTDEGTYAEVYCLDLETNAKARKEIFTKHVAPRWNRDARQMQKTQLTDEREIYEHTANLETRRLRACMEAIMPKALLDACVRVCDQVVVAEAAMNDKSVPNLVKAFGKLGVTPQMLEKWLGYPLAKITPRRFVRLRRIHQSIKDGFGAPSDWFRGASQARLVEERLKSGAKPGKGSAPEEIVPESGSQSADSWKMSDEEIEDGLKQSKAVEKEVDVEPEPVDDWVEKATGDLK